MDTPLFKSKVGFGSHECAYPKCKRKSDGIYWIMSATIDGEHKMSCTGTYTKLCFEHGVFFKIAEPVESRYFIVVPHHVYNKITGTRWRTQMLCGYKKCKNDMHMRFWIMPETEGPLSSEAKFTRMCEDHFTIVCLLDTENIRTAAVIPRHVYNKFDQN